MLASVLLVAGSLAPCRAQDVIEAGAPPPGFMFSPAPAGCDLSGTIMFRLMRDVSAPGVTRWSVEAPDGTMFEPGSGIEPDPFDPSRVGYYSDAYSTFDYPDGTWTVTAELDGGGSPIQAAFQMVNLTVTGTEAHRSSGGTGLVELDELWVAIPEDMMVGWEVDLADGQEPAANPFLVDVDFSLGTLGTGSSGSGANDGSAPGTVTGLILNPGTVPVGFYYKAAHAVERRSAGAPPTGDEAHNLSSHWHLTNATVTGYEYKGARHARLTVEADLDTAAMPSQESYAWCRPLPRSHAETLVPDLLTVPSTTTTISLGDVTAVFGGAGGLDLSVAGLHHLAMAFRDTRTYHQPGLGRWTVPEGVTLDVPAAGCWVDSEVARVPLASTQWTRLGVLTAPGTAQETFYSATCPEGVRGGVVQTGREKDWYDSLQTDQVLYVDCHGVTGGGSMHPCRFEGAQPTGDFVPDGYVDASEILALASRACASVEFVFLGCCYGWDAGDESMSVGDALLARGVETVVASHGADFNAADPKGQDFYNYLWEEWTAGDTIADGLQQAKDRLVATHQTLGHAANMTAKGQPTTTVISPAFALGR
ncbi:MAG: CHAT domain-containing protein [Armatimonadia bacterium]|nr:CHAT domain-containing protein [Armatimonadia bacterium]